MPSLCSMPHMKKAAQDGQFQGDNMLKVVSKNIWICIQDKAKHAEQRKGAIAYVTDTRLLPLRADDVLVTDASDASIAGGRTSATAIDQYFRAGVNLFSLPALHAKVIVLDDWAVIGSANASRNSASVYFEAAVITDRPDVVGQTDTLIQSFADAATPIDKAFVERILKIPVVRTPEAFKPKRPSSLKHVGASTEQRFWLVSLHDEAAYPGNKEAVEKVSEQLQRKSNAGIVDWFWWRGNARFPSQAREGDVIVECLRPLAKIQTTRRVRVYRHGRIARIFQEPGVKAKTFHCIWPSDHNDRSVSWSEFQKLAKRAGVNRKLSYKSTVELTPKQSSALFEIWP